MTAKIVVTAAGLALIVFINWFFLFSGGRRGRLRAPLRKRIRRSPAPRIEGGRVQR